MRTVFGHAARRAVVPVALAGTLLTACSSSGAGGGAPSPGPSGPSTVAASEAQNGRHISVAVGGDVVVRLHSTYWHFVRLSGTSPLRRISVDVHGVKTRIPGIGKGTVTATFHAASAGQTTIVAARVTCGEALRCTGQQGSYHLTVSVHR